MKGQYRPTYVMADGKIDRDPDGNPLLFASPTEAREHIREMEKHEPHVRREIRDAPELD